MRAVSPTGSLISGTLERVYGVAQIEEDSFRAENGRLGFEYGGYTEVDWNSQVSVLRDEQLVFVDEQGAEWLEKDITLVNEDEEEDEE